MCVCAEIVLTLTDVMHFKVEYTCIDICVIHVRFIEFSKQLYSAW